ncbi:MAG: YbhB/YbcL family Raf kinase inhibitor-like protein [Halobacteria archaeon]
MELSSHTFEDGEAIPERHGYKALNTIPELTIQDVPDEAESLALVMDDPDALEPAGQVWDHWIVWNISPEVKEIQENQVPEGIDGKADEGTNDYGEVGYGGPNPPDGEHTYIFKLYALDTVLDLDKDDGKDELEDAIDGNVIQKSEHTGTYAP